VVKFALINGVRLAYDVRGAGGGSVVVLLHALGQNRQVWAGVAEALARGHRVYSIDLRGHGESDRCPDYSLEAMRDDVLALLDELGIKQVDLIGHSLGGVVAWLVTEEQPERVGHLVVEDSPPPRPDMAQVRLKDRPQGPVQFDWAAIEGVVAQLNAPDPAWWELLPSVPTPVLLLAGGAASHVPQQLIHEAACRVPRAEHVTIPVGHNIHRDAQETFVKVVTAFLAQPPAGGGVVG
jgi:pimeloyl-ACP methyl ester carboxylesterase